VSCPKESPSVLFELNTINGDGFHGFQDAVQISEELVAKTCRKA
jgi:hypothetical protein